MFTKAVKHEAKGRVALVGPAGSGKSYTALRIARALAGPTGKIAAVDTEHGSLSKYADLFDFDVVELDSYTADNFFSSLRSAEQNGYAVMLYDSMSHFWMGKDGTLEFVDERTKAQRTRGGDGMAGWKDWTPTERRMIDAILASPCHVIVTMRTKTEYREEEYTNNRGEKKTKRVKVGLMPVQRAGLEYEFDLIGYMDDENNFVTDKTRCPHYTRKAIASPSEKDFAPFVEWLKGAPPPPPKTQPTHAEVRDAKLAEAAASGIKVTPPPVDDRRGERPPVEIEQMLARMKDRYAALEVFGELKDQYMLTLGDEAGKVRYYEVLGRYEVKKSDQFKTLGAAQKCAIEMKSELMLKKMNDGQEAA